jgi:hypothetical protein
MCPEDRIIQWNTNVKPASSSAKLPNPESKAPFDSPNGRVSA